MLRIIQRFGKHCSCHLQGECVVVGRIWKPYIGAGSRWRIGYDGADWWNGRAGYYHTFTPKMATAMFVETLDNYQHSTRLNPESRSYISNSTCGQEFMYCSWNIGSMQTQMIFHQPGNSYKSQ
jgi:hypothetical protein